MATDPTTPALNSGHSSVNWQRVLGVVVTIAVAGLSAWVGVLAALDTGNIVGEILLSLLVSGIIGGWHRKVSRWTEDVPTGDRPGSFVVPLVLLALLSAAVAYGVTRFTGYVQSVQSTETVQTQFVLRRLTETVRVFEPIPLGGGRAINGKVFWLSILFLVPLAGGGVMAYRRLRLNKPISIAAILVEAALCVPLLVALVLSARSPERTPFLEVDSGFFYVPIMTVLLAVGFVYVIWMYTHDAQSVGWLWATFLGATRLTVYALLAGVFLLPALQKWEKSEAFSRVLLLLDLSGSMGLVDAVIEEGRPTPPSRLEQVESFLAQLTAPADGITINGRKYVAGEVIPADEAAKITPEQKTKLKTFLTRLTEKNPVVVYAIGGRLDEDGKELKKDSPAWSAADLARWMRMDLKPWVLEGISPEGQKLVEATDAWMADKPGTPEWAGEWIRLGKIPENLSPADKEILASKREKLPRKVETRQQLMNSTNYGDSVLAALTRESTNMLAGIVVVGDGASNQGSPSSYDELRRRAQNMKVPIFTVGVGEVRELINIRITELQAPEQVPPDEAFLIRVEVDGEGLADKDFAVTLDIYKPGEPKTPAHQMTLPGKFKRVGGGTPHGTIEFKIDPRAEEFAPLTAPVQGKPELIEGEWKFIARINKAKGEAEPTKQHVSDASTVQVIKKPLRVLLFAGGPTREYQFTRRLFVNEVDKKRAELSIFLQVADQKGPRVQDVPQERLLKSFPTFLRVEEDPAEKPDDKWYNLAQYDLIIAFDPDWTQVPREHLDLLQKWVEVQAGGLIVVGGPIHSFQLARGGNLDKLKPVVDLMPVRLEDSRLQGLNVDRPTNKPWRLNFSGVTGETEFLKLDDDRKKADKPEPLAGWEEFFTGRETGSPPPPAGETPQRGFYSYYPVKSVKPTAQVIATFTDPTARMNKDDGTNEEQPYLAWIQVGKGKCVYLSSGEMWRLRLFKEIYHERLWTKLGRFAASGTQTKQTRRGSINIGRQYTVGQYIRFNVPMFSSDLTPMARTAEPSLKIQPPGEAKPVTVKLKPRPDGEWDGTFQGQYQVTLPGEYQFEVPVPGSSEVLKSKALVKEANLELDHSRPDFALLRNQLASAVSETRVNETLKKELTGKLQGVSRPASDGKADTKAGPAVVDEEDPKLFFDLKTAKIIPEYLTTDRKTQKSRGPIEDLWPAGPQMSIFGVHGPVGMILLIAVSLLSVEWLTRKLLRLA